MATVARGVVCASRLLHQRPACSHASHINQCGFRGVRVQFPFRVPAGFLAAGFVAYIRDMTTGKAVPIPEATRKMLDDAKLTPSGGEFVMESVREGGREESDCAGSECVKH